MRQLNLDQIKALLEVVTCGSFTAAAQNLNLTQPAVSLQIQELEARFKVTLVERVGRRVQPTPAGRELVQIGQRLLDQVEDAHAIMRRYSEGYLGRVRLGLSMTALIYLMPDVIRDFRATLPLIEVVMRTDYSVGTLQSVRENELDIGLCIGPITDKLVEAHSLGAERMVAIFPPDATDVPAVIDAAAITGWPIILGHPKSAVRALVEDWLKAAGPLPRPIMELDNVAGIKSVVGAGIGASIVPEMSMRSRDAQLIVRPLAPPIARELFIVRRRDKVDDPAIRQVHQVLVRNLVKRG